MFSLVLLCSDVFIHLSFFWADDNPTVMGLQQFKTKDGKTVNLYNHIAPKLDTFGTCILDDDAGNKMSIINDENTKVDKKVNSVIKDWLLGECILVM